MPVDFLTSLQKEKYGKYPETISSTELSRYFYLDDADLHWITSKRLDSTKLGYALQLCTVRFLGIFLVDPTIVPKIVLDVLKQQIKLSDISCLSIYRESEQRKRHAIEIRTRYGYHEFMDKGVRFRLGRLLCAMCWTGPDRPSVLFDHACAWLIANKILLPGFTTIERFIAEIRSRMEIRLWKYLTKNVTAIQQEQLENLLTLVEEGSRQSWLDRLRKGPTRISAPALVAALDRITTIRDLGISLSSASHIPQTRLAALARFATTAKVTAINRLSNEKRTAILVAFVHCLEYTAQDDAMDVLDMLLRDIFSAAQAADRKARLRSIRDLDRAAILLAEACYTLLDPSLPETSLRSKIDSDIGLENLELAVNSVKALTRPPHNVFYEELEKKRRTVSRFMHKLLTIIQFESNPEARPLLQALTYLKDKNNNKKLPLGIINKSWFPYVYDENGEINNSALTFCFLNQLHTAIKKRDVFIHPSWRYCDPRSGLLSSQEWNNARQMICRSLNLSTDYKPMLDALALELDQTYQSVSNKLASNKFLRFETNAGREELILSPLAEDTETPTLIALKKEIRSRMPIVDLPEIILEIAAITEFTSAFGHVSEANSRAKDLNTSLCAVLLAQSCNTGIEPFTNEDIPALKRDRLVWVEQNYLRDETLLDANAILVAAQNKIDLAKIWGGGDVASADGMRFTVPVRTIHAAPNPKYFAMGKGITWYNLISDQRTGLNAITVPGTLRDSLILLSVVLDQQTELQPTQIMTDTGAYSDVVFGLFRLLGYRFCPRLADVTGTKFWRIDKDADYGKLNTISKSKVKLYNIEPHWDDVLRLVGSLKLGRVPATGIMRTLQVGDRATSLATAIAEIGRIDKTIHVLNYIDDENLRRKTLIQLNLGEGRHALARNIFHGKRGEVYQRYREGQEDQLSALGLIVNAVVLWNTIYMDAIIKQLRAEGYPIHEEDLARLNPFGHEYINMLGRYHFFIPDMVARGELRPFRKPKDEDRSPIS